MGDTTGTAAEVKKNFELYQDRALHGPVMMTARVGLRW